MKIISGTRIDFIGKRYFYFVLSSALIIAGLVSVIIKGGFLAGIDFGGGYLYQVNLTPPVPMSDVRNIISSAIGGSFELQNLVGSQDEHDIIIRVRKGDKSTEEIKDAIESKIKEFSPGTAVRWDRVEYVGPVVGKYLKKQAVFAITFSLLGIIIYVGFRFKSLIWGAAGVIALAHDVWIVLGLFSIFNKEITLTVIAALLTLAGYSINDTIVIFDRIRENLRLRPREPLESVINVSINETLSRTIITSLTVFFVVLSLYLFGGTVLKDFSFALLVGVVVGTYSSVCVASPIVYEWNKRRQSPQSRR
jgi:preprotein translocase subunit SecF